MGYDFNADEIFAMAQQIEKKGMEFYADAARTIENSAARAFLLRLSEMERAHEKTFADMRSRLTDPERTPPTFDPAGEAVLYLKALADTRIFFEKTIDSTSLQEVLKIAIEAEKESIVFYLGMKELVPAEWGKDRLDDIIREEMGHIRLLAGELTAARA